MKHRALITATLALLGAHGTALAGGPFAIDWFTIDGGGGTLTGGNFAITGAIGQHDAGRTSGGQFCIDGGYWPVGLPPLCLGDADGNGQVNFADITSVLAQFGQGASACDLPAGDADGSGIVNFADITAVLANFGITCLTN